MKYKILVISIIIFLLSLLCGISVAYYTTDIVATNVITSGSVDIEIFESYNLSDIDRVPYNSQVNVLPDNTRSKIVDIKNTGLSPIYLRVCIDDTIVKQNNESENDTSSLIKYDINTDKWIEHNGYYYYKTCLMPDEFTSPLFTTVYFDKSIDNQYMKSIVNINIIAEATQSENNGFDPLSAKGWCSVEAEY